MHSENNWLFNSHEDAKILEAKNLIKADLSHSQSAVRSTRTFITGHQSSVRINRRRRVEGKFLTGI